LIVAADFTIATPPQLSDSLGNTFALAIGPLVAVDSTFWTAIWYVLDAKGGNETVTLTLASGRPIDQVEAYVHEYKGLTGLDGTGGAAGTTTMMDTGAIVTMSSGDLLFAYTATGAANPGMGFAVRSNFAGNLSEDKILGAPGSYHATATMVRGTTWTIVGAAFKTH
jgi:hypothetical protein